MAHEIVTIRNRFLPVLQAVVLSVAALYFGRPVLMPLALAILLTFLLRPLVSGLERWRLPRVAAVGVVMVLIVAVLSVVGWRAGTQLGELATKLPEYRSHFRGKLADLRKSSKVFSRIKEAFQDVSEPVAEATEPNEEARALAAARRAEAVLAQPRLVRVVAEADSPFDTARLLVISFSEVAATGAIVVVLVIFMLMEYEELRNRLVRLAGTSRLTLTTRTLDEAGKRVERYLVMNALVNGGFGLAIWIGLHLIGVSYAPLWGVMAALFRFIPYVGPLIAFVAPFGLAVIQYPDWTHPAFVVALFGGVELITNTVIEPLTYGQSAGVSTVALLISAMFWTWVWGPMGLILSVPMTVMLTVLGKYISHLEPLQILLGDAPALPPYASYYQRLLAGDLEEAAEILEDAYAAQPLIQVYDAFIIPAVELAERDQAQGDLTAAEKEIVWHTTRSLVDENAPGKQPDAGAAVEKDALGANLPPGKSEPPVLYLLGCPAFDVADELALILLQHLMTPRHVELRVMTAASLASEVLAAIEERLPDAVWISALGPGGVGQTRYLCKRIHQSYPQMRIFVGRWGFRGDRERMTASLKARGANQVVMTLEEACNQIERIQSVQSVPPLKTLQPV